MHIDNFLHIDEYFLKTLNKRGVGGKKIINKLDSVPNHHQTIVVCFISSVVQFDKFFHYVFSFAYS